MKAVGLHFSAKYIVLQVLILLCALALVVFRTVPITRIWDDYKVMYVDKSVAEADVLETLYTAGCKDVVSLSLQKSPVVTPFMEFQQNSSSYLQDRLGYFSDKSSSYNLFYIPDQYEREAGVALRSIIKDTHSSAGLDSESTIPFVVPLVSVAVYIILGLASTKKRYFFVPAFFLVVLSFSMPFYTVAAGVCLFLFAVYLANKLWGRKSDASAILKNATIDVLLVSSVVILCTHSLLCGVLALAALCACLASIILLKESAAQNANQSSFKYTLIFNAYQVSVINKKNMNSLLFMTVPMIILLLSFLFSAKFMPRNSVSGIELPSPVSKEDGEFFLPTINDYFKWAWNTLTYPYRSVNYLYSENVAEGDSVVISHFLQKDSLVQEKETALYTYNNDFRKQLVKDIENLDYPAIEKLMERQGRDVSVAYSLSRQPVKSSSDIINLIMLVAALMVPLFLCLSYYYGMGRRI